MSRTRFWFAVVLAFALLASACSSSSNSTSSTVGESTVTTAAAVEELTVGLVTINLQALFFNQINEGAQRVADAEGVNLEIFNANNDPVAQNDAIENFVASGVDALIVLAIDVEGILPAVADARAAGVPVVAIDAILEAGAADVQVGTDNEAAGAKMGEFLLETSGGSGEVGIVGALNSYIQNLRQAGFEDTVVAGGMEIAGVVDGRNVQEDALTSAENLMTGNPDMKYVYATGEPALIGLVSAVQSQGAQDSITVVGWDLSDAAVDGIREGFVAGVVQQDTFRFGEEGMRSAIALAKGRPVGEVIPIDTFIVTPDNVDDFLFFLE
ncbi:MAG: sugar ABC transporter substrate-binding protein [Actinobacteria bacterium]|nr:sugar ABC transporter substrate-binding protein [Actinomycetota bacterium]